MRGLGATWDRAALGWLAGALALASVAGWGGQPPVAPPPGETADAGSKVDETPFTVEDRGRRDPFTFRRKPTIEAPPPIQPPGEGAAGTGVVDDRMPPEQVLERKQKAEEAYNVAETAFMDFERDARMLEVVSKCDKGLDVLKEIPNLAKYRDLQLLELRERLLDLRRAAERLRQRQDAEKRFRELSIRVTGVVVRERHSQAIINGEIVGRGYAIKVGESLEPPVVEEIRPDQVIFVFQGYKMALTLSDISRVR
jgi:hypothetical protein